MEERVNNYRIARDRAMAYFLNFDQEALIRTWNLQYDANRLYLEFLGHPYAVCRKTGVITRCWDQQEAEFDEVLSIFDLLCHEGNAKAPSGQYGPVNSLNGRPSAIGVGTAFHTKIAETFDRNRKAFSDACIALGGTPISLGDLGFSFPVFDGMQMQLKFYESDEDFPASIVLLWDNNLLQYVYYETVFYIGGFLLQFILEQMGAAPAN